MSASAAILLQWLSDNADIGDPGLFHGVHNRGESAKGHVLIGANENRLPLRIANLLVNSLADLVDIDWIVVKKNLLLAIDGDDQALFGYLFHRPGVRNFDFDS